MKDMVRCWHSGITIPGIQQTRACGTWGHGLVAVAGFCGRLDSLIPEGFSRFCDSMTTEGGSGCCRCRGSTVPSAVTAVPKVLSPPVPCRVILVLLGAQLSLPALPSTGGIVGSQSLAGMRGQIPGFLGLGPHLSLVSVPSPPAAPGAARFLLQGIKGWIQCPSTALRGSFTLTGIFWAVFPPPAALLDEQGSFLQAGAADPGSGVTCSPLAARGGQNYPPNYPQIGSPLKRELGGDLAAPSPAAGQVLRPLWSSRELEQPQRAAPCPKMTQKSPKFFAWNDRKLCWWDWGYSSRAGNHCPDFFCSAGHSAGHFGGHFSGHFTPGVAQGPDPVLPLEFGNSQSRGLDFQNLPGFPAQGFALKQDGAPASPGSLC